MQKIAQEQLHFMVTFYFPPLICLKSYITDYAHEEIQKGTLTPTPQATTMFFHTELLHRLNFTESNPPARQPRKQFLKYNSQEQYFLMIV